ncbi:MAG TPA: peptidylprolyl isomerase [Methylococcaceae bacterium]|jgi:peptidyl-prolyl cis-trans isomerase C|nr:peptidylprolyl isomerase [Methylococcaceae bacterium]
MKKRIIPLVLASSYILTACNALDNSSSATTVAKEDAIAAVNGQYISKASFAQMEKEITQRSPNHTFPKEQLIEELIQRELLIQDAVNKKLDQDAEFTARLVTIKNSLLSQAAVQNYIKSNPVTDAEIEAEYNKNISEASTEYKARHILLKTEKEAKALIKELTAGADFIALAKAKSTGPSGAKGGDLGWFTANQMVGPFSEATIALEDGQFSSEPVQSQFGWHIILKEGSRELNPPSLESVKARIRPALQRQKTQDFMDNLRQQAKIEIFLPEAPEVLEPAPTPEKVEAAATTAESETASKAPETVTP